MSAIQPEKHGVRVGFIALTDCAPLVMAAALGFDQRHGITIELSREASWAGVRDKLLNGELDAAHALYGMVYGVQLGVGAVRRDMAVLMNLNHNGQAITLSRQLAEQGAVDGPSLAKLMREQPRRSDGQTFTFAQTFPTGTHAMWLYYWLAAHGIDPLRDARVITVAPPQMVAHMRAGHMDGFCVGEPWGGAAVLEGVGVTAATSQQIWPDHPEKVLATTADFADRHPETSRALIAAVLDASRWIAASEANQRETAATLAKAQYVNASTEAITGRFLGHYEDGLGRSWEDPGHLAFYDDGKVNFPYLSDGMWFMTQLRRWGLLKDDPDYRAVAAQVHRIALYRDGALRAEVPVPEALTRSSTLIDGVVWDGSDPAGYAASFAIRA